jgi:hypothetical protein
LGLGLQAWITGTDQNVFGTFGDQAQYFAVEAAQVRPIEL